MEGKPPLRQTKKTDYFQAERIQNELMDFQFDYFYSGKIIGHRKTGLIELFITTYLIDDQENLFIRYATYSGNGKKWREAIENQIRQLMYDCDISKQIANGQLRFFEVDQSKQLNIEQYENAFLELKSKAQRE